MAVLIQTLSAKLGIATGNNLPEIARENFPKPVSIGLWIQGELVIMATDLAEFIGAALGFTYYLNPDATCRFNYCKPDHLLFLSFNVEDFVH